MAWILVTPSSRGIGHALTRHLLKTTPASIPIIATTRTSKSETKTYILSDLDLNDKQSSRLDVQTVDLLSEPSIAELASYCKDRYQHNSNNKDNSNEPPHLRLGFFLPGMLQPEKAPSQINYDSALETFKLNTLAPMMLLKHFVPFLPKKSFNLPSHPHLPSSAVLACMSARVGSISDNRLGGWYSYRASKAALNQVVKSIDIYVKMQAAGKACVVGLHPGTVKTGLSKEFWGNVKKEKLFSAEFASERLVQVVGKAGGNVDGYRGRCWDWDDKEVQP